MSTTALKRTLAEAIAEAEEFRALFPCNCYERWEVAGSVRRRRPEVGDVEHVIIPTWGEVQIGGGLFDQTDRVNLLWHHAAALVEAGTLKKHIYGTTGFRWGPKYRGVEFRGHLHEMWTAEPGNWGSRLAVLTGPATFSREIMQRFNSAGMFRQEEGQLVRVETGEPVPTPDEIYYFKLAGLPWIEPHLRR